MNETGGVNRATAVCRMCDRAGAHPSWQARDLRNPDGRRFTYFECAGCGCLQIENPPDDLAPYYTDEYYSFAPVSERKHSDGRLKGALRSIFRLARRIRRRGSRVKR